MISWEEGGASWGCTSHVGKVGRFIAFEIYFDGMRSKNAKGGNWVIRCKLFGYKSILPKTYYGVADAKEYCHRALQKWMTETGFTFAKDVPEEGDW